MIELGLIGSAALSALGPLAAAVFLGVRLTRRR